jgi:hypothetical protein
MVNRLTCAICGKPAMAYAVAKDGTRTGLCLQHMPICDVDQPYGILLAGRGDSAQPKTALDPDPM